MNNVIILGSGRSGTSMVAGLFHTLRRKDANTSTSFLFQFVSARSPASNRLPAWLSRFAWRGSARGYSFTAVIELLLSVLQLIHLWFRNIELPIEKGNLTGNCARSFAGREPACPGAAVASFLLVIEKHGAVGRRGPLYRCRHLPSLCRFDPAVLVSG